MDVVRDLHRNAAGIGSAVLAAALLVAVLVPGAGAQESLPTIPIRPIIDADNGVLGAELFGAAGPVEFFGGGGYGLFTGELHYQAGVTLGALRQRLTVAYRDWPGSLVQGRRGQTGTALAWELTPEFGATLKLTTFQGTLWPVTGEAEGPEAWVMGADASYRLPLARGWWINPRLISVRGALIQTGDSFTSHLAVARIRHGWSGLQVAGGALRSDDVPEFQWRLGGGGTVPLRGYKDGHATGDRILGLSAEQRVPLPFAVPLAQLQIAFFIDAADALARDQGWDELSLSVGYGTGLVLSTALGELHADLAWNPNGELVPAIWLSAAF